MSTEAADKLKVLLCLDISSSGGAPTRSPASMAAAMRVSHLHQPRQAALSAYF